MKRIVLVRHGQTVANREGLFRGRTDFPLDDLGRKQAEWVADAIKQRFDAVQGIYTSPLSRAYDTAWAIAKRFDLDPLIHEGFTNIALGEWEGKEKEYIKREYPKLWNLWVTDPEKLTLPGGEGVRDVRERSIRALNDIVKGMKDGDTMVVVSHRAVLKPLISGCIGLQSPYFWKLHIDTASFSVLEYWDKRGFVLTLLNETCHLKEFVSEFV